MARFTRGHNPLMLAALAFLALVAVAIAPPSARAQAQTTYALTILGPAGPIARVITTDTQCPQITIDGTTSAMEPRGARSADFPVTVCSAPIPTGAQKVSVSGQGLPLVKSKPARIVVIGDTGCRLKNNNIQGCNVPAEWPFATLAANAAISNPDLVIDVGDYNYRESPCQPDKANCNGSPYGDNWAAWNADFFTPARPLFQAAPWVIVPGNHEDCSRGGLGFFLLLDPRPAPPACPQYTDPYALSYMDPQLIVVDDSAVNDYQIEPDQVAVFTKQFQQINGMAQAPAWILLHDPLYVFGHLGVQDGKEQLFIDQLTLQQASNNTFPPAVQAFVSGHIHLFETLSFGAGRPPQIVVGSSGTLLDKPITTPLAGLEMAGMKVASGSMMDKWGYVLLQRSGANWALALRDPNGGILTRCTLGGGALECGQNLPATGGDFTLASPLWLALAALGLTCLLGGLALLLYANRRSARG